MKVPRLCNKFADVLWNIYLEQCISCYRLYIVMQFSFVDKKTAQKLFHDNINRKYWLSCLVEKKISESIILIQIIYRTCPAEEQGVAGAWRFRCRREDKALDLNLTHWRHHRWRHFSDWFFSPSFSKLCPFQAGKLLEIWTSIYSGHEEKVKRWIRAKVSTLRSKLWSILATVLSILF